MCSINLILKGLFISLIACLLILSGDLHSNCDVSRDIILKDMFDTLNTDSERAMKIIESFDTFNPIYYSLAESKMDELMNNYSTLNHAERIRSIEITTYFTSLMLFQETNSNRALYNSIEGDLSTEFEDYFSENFKIKISKSYRGLEWSSMETIILEKYNLCQEANPNNFNISDLEEHPKIRSVFVSCLRTYGNLFGLISQISFINNEVGAWTKFDPEFISKIREEIQLTAINYGNSSVITDKNQNHHMRILRNSMQIDFQIIENLEKISNISCCNSEEYTELAILYRWKKIAATTNTIMIYQNQSLDDSQIMNLALKEFEITNEKITQGQDQYDSDFILPLWLLTESTSSVESVLLPPTEERLYWAKILAFSRASNSLADIWIDCLEINEKNKIVHTSSPPEVSFICTGDRLEECEYRTVRRFNAVKDVNITWKRPDYDNVSKVIFKVNSKEVIPNKYYSELEGANIYWKELPLQEGTNVVEIIAVSGLINKQSTIQPIIMIGPFSIQTRDNIANLFFPFNGYRTFFTYSSPNEDESEFKIKIPQKFTIGKKSGLYTSELFNKQECKIEDFRQTTENNEYKVKGDFSLGWLYKAKVVMIHPSHFRTIALLAIFVFILLGIFIELIWRNLKNGPKTKTYMGFKLSHIKLLLPLILFLFTIIIHEGSSWLITAFFTIGGYSIGWIISKKFIKGRNK